MSRSAVRTASIPQPLRLATALAVALTMLATLLAVAVAVAPRAAAASSITETFRGTTAPGWQFLNTACLTDAPAGDPRYCARDAGVPTANQNGFGTPAAGNDGTGFLQLTSNRHDGRGGALYNTAIDAENGLRIEFNQYQYGPDRGSTRAADGISFFLVDGGVELTSVGAEGGALGYGRRISDNTPGINGGFLGIGLDTYGNFSNTAHVGGTDCTISPGETESMYGDPAWNPAQANLAGTNAIALRGPMGATNMQGYCLLSSSKLDSHGTDGSSTSSWGTKSLWADSVNDAVPATVDVEGAARRIRIILKPGATPTDNASVSVSIDFSGTGNNYVSVINNLPIDPLPAAGFKFGFSSSTGGSTGSHLISNLAIVGNPTADSDSVTLGQWGTGTFDVASLVHPGAFDIPSTGAYRLVDPTNPTNFGTSFNVVEDGVTQGVWTINPDTGATTYTPAPGISQTGQTPTISFRVVDENGTAATGQLSVTYEPATGDSEKPVEPGGTATFATSDLATIPGSGAIAGYQLLNPTTGDPIPTNSFTDVHGGVWTINPNTGVTTYAAHATYRGAVPSIDYRVTDANGLTDDGTLSIAMGPAADDEVKNAARGSSVTFDPIGDLVDAGSSGNIVITLEAPDSPGGTTKTVAGQGTWTLNPATGEITFAPAAGFTGNVTPIAYRATDGNTLFDTGTLDVNYPPATGDSSKVVQPGATATFAPTDLATSPGSSSTLTYSLLDPTTGNPIQSNTFTDTHGGVWTLNPTTGQTTYVADPDYRGPVPTIDYRVTDGNGLSDAGTLGIDMPPSAQDEAKTATPNTPVVFDPIGDLIDPGSSNTLTVTLTDPDAGTPNTKTVPGQGVWTVDPATGQITFVPEQDFAGTVTPIEYVVTDGNNQTDTAQLVVLYGPSTGDAVEIVQPGDTATFEPSDLATVPGSNTDLTYTLLTPGTGTPVLAYTDSVGGEWTINPNTGETTYEANPSYRGPVPPIDYRVTDGNSESAEGTLTILVPPAADGETKTSNPGLPVSFDPIGDLTDDGSDPNLTVTLVTPDPGTPNTKTVPGQGTWTLVPGTGVITFTPETGFTGQPDPIDYRVTDGNTLTDTATITVFYNQPPTAPDETVTVNPGTPATLTPTITPGTDTSVTVSLDGSDAGDPTKKTVPGQGVWTTDPNTGVTTFTPEPGFTGNPTPVTYTVTDGNGLTDTGTLTVTVNTPPKAVDEAKTGKPGESVEFDPIGDLTTPGSDTTLTVTLIDPETGQPATGNTVVVPGKGTWIVDTATGKITFTPESGFSGKVTIGYRVTDGNTLFDEANLDVTISAATDTDSGDNGDEDEDTGTGTRGDGDDNLPQTGVDFTRGISVALALLIAGAGLVVITRRQLSRQ